jgi:hypothetical protein
VLRALNIDFLCGIGRYVESQRHQSFIGEKGKIISRVVYVERIPGNLTRADITGLPGALNKVSGILVIPARLIPREAHHVTAQPNSEKISFTLCTNIESAQKGLS